MKTAIPLSEKNLKQTFVLQHDQSDCGIACLLSLKNFMAVIVL